MLQSDESDLLCELMLWIMHTVNRSSDNHVCDNDNCFNHSGSFDKHDYYKVSLPAMKTSDGKYSLNLKKRRKRIGPRDNLIIHFILDIKISNSTKEVADRLEADEKRSDLAIIVNENVLQCRTAYEFCCWKYKQRRLAHIYENYRVSLQNAESVACFWSSALALS